MNPNSVFMAIAPCAAVPPEGTVIQDGKVEFDDATTEVRTGAKVTKDGDVVATDAIAITVKCTKNPHVIQFVHREVLGTNGERKSYRLTTTSGPEVTTTDPSHPQWLTDADAHDKTTPYYDTGGGHISNPSGLTVYDEPALYFRPDGPSPSQPQAPIVLKPGETSRATFKAYTLCDGKVVKEITWVRSVTAPKAPIYSKPEVKDVKALPPWAKEQLRKDKHFDPTDPASIQERAKTFEKLKGLPDQAAEERKKAIQEILKKK